MNDDGVFVIEPSRFRFVLKWQEVWRHRELLGLMAWRDVKVRYKHPLIGVLWTLAQPVLSVLILTLVFGRTTSRAADAAPYWLFTLCGFSIWLFFAAAVGQSARALIASQALITKVYFPRIIVPLAGVVSAAIDLVLNLGVVLACVVVVIRPGFSVLVAPLYLLLVLLICVGLSAFVAAASAMYRDLQHVVPFALQLGLFATPVFYSASSIPERWRWLIEFNPLAAAIEGFREALLGSAADPPRLFVALVGSVTLFLGGTGYFASVERRLADVI